MSSRQRRQSGASLVLAVACAFVLVLLVVAALQLMSIFNGSDQVRNVVDAGVLNVATHAPEITVPARAPFDDVGDSKGRLGLTNINRAFGKAMLINMNAQDMQNSGQAGNSTGNAQAAASTSSSIGQSLADALQHDPGSQINFAAVADKQSSTGSSSGGGGAGSGTDTPSGVAVSFVHRGSESNLVIDLSQLPSSIKFDPKKVVGNCVAGYSGVPANGQQFMFVPFRKNEMPHLISTEEFQSDSPKQNPIGVASAVPNAYQMTGTIENGTMKSIASAVANPQRSYKLAIPHAFVLLKFAPTTTKWLVNNNPAGADTQYKMANETQWGVQSFSVGCNSKLNGYASLGNEYKSKDLYSVLTAIPGNHTTALNDITQRMREVDSSFSSAKLVSLLKQQQFVPETYDYYIHPVYSTPDNTDPKIQISPKGQVSSSWLNQSAPADGTESSVGTEQLVDDPNSAWGQVMGIWQLQNKKVQVDGQVLWTPGTGYNQCLGQLRIDRKAKVTFTGKCPP